MAEQREPLESLVDESGMEFEPYRVQEQQNIEEKSVQPNSIVTEEQPDVKERVVTVQPTQSGLGLESHTVPEQPNDEKDTSSQIRFGSPIRFEALESLLKASNLYNLGNIGSRKVGEADNGMQASSVATQPTRAGLEQQPDVEEGAIQAGCGVSVQPAKAGLGLESHSLQDQPNVKEHATLVLRSVLTAFNRHYLNTSDFIDMRAQNDSQEISDLEEYNGIQARTGEQQVQDVPPEQGTAVRRMRLQVSSLQLASDHKAEILGLQLSDAISRCYELHGASLEAPLGCAKGLSELKCVSIEGTCICGRTSFEQETGKAEGDTKKPICSESDYSDVVQQIPQDVSGPSLTPRLRLLTSLVNFLLGLLGDAVFCLHLKPSYTLRWKN